MLGVRAPQGIGSTLRSPREALHLTEGLPLDEGLRRTQHDNRTRWSAGPQAQRTIRALRRMQARKGTVTGAQTPRAPKEPEEGEPRFRMGRLAVSAR